jgi:hypothetical protein
MNTQPACPGHPPGHAAATIRLRSLAAAIRFRSPPIRFRSAGLGYSVVCGVRRRRDAGRRAHEIFTDGCQVAGKGLLR